MFNNQMTKEKVIEIVKEKKVDFIRLQFVDIMGTMKNVAITAKELGRVLEDNMMFDGSSIQGFVRVEESDMHLKPDPSTFTIMPWFKDHTIARMICDICTPDGIPFMGDPRYILRKAIEEGKEMGYDFHVGPECEFFLFQTDSEGNPTTKTHDQASYFDLAPVDNGEMARIDMVKTLMDMGFQVEAAHHESAPGQHEIDFKYSDALKAADNIITFKLVVKVIAEKFGLHATFMPKPLNGEFGSGMHCNMSLFKDGKNAFYDENGVDGLSKEAYYFVGGLLKHAKGMAALTNPIVNSYKRLVPGYEAPVYVSWSASNRSPLIRIPTARGTGTRIELRNPDPACNPYLALAAMLRAGLEGIKDKIEPCAPVNHNVYNLTDEELKNLGIENLPKDLDQAIDELLKDKVISDVLGEHVLKNYVKAKRIEWAEYSAYVSSWEVDKYIKKY